MKIYDDHLYHGAALIQIAEHSQFTAINALKIKDKILRTAYKINDDIGIYLKYGQRPRNSFKEYTFTFRNEHLKELDDIAEITDQLFLALVCVKDREVCCLSYAQLKELIEKRKRAKRSEEEQYSILVTIPQGKSIRAYVNAPGVRKMMLKPPLTIPRKNFPDMLFG
jgi:hypothetical protein